MEMIRTWIVGVLAAALLMLTPAHAADTEAPALKIGDIEYTTSIRMDGGAKEGYSGPLPPEHVSAVVRPHGVEVRWEKSADLVDNYVIRRDGIVIATSLGLNHTDPDGAFLSAYTISSRKDSGEGRPSNPAVAENYDCINIHVGALPPVYVVPATCIEQTWALYRQVVSQFTIAMPAQVRELLDEARNDVRAIGWGPVPVTGTHNAVQGGS